MDTIIDNISALVKALEAGSYDAKPTALVQGAALQIEDLSDVMHNVTFDDSHIVLQRDMKIDTAKATLVQFDRQLSYGIFGGSAQIEGQIGTEETSDFIRAAVPMSYYSHTRHTTIVANMVATVDGKKAEERAAADAAKKIAGDIEFDLFRGMADFSNAGVFDGNPNPAVLPALPNMQGVDLQVRQSDNLRNTRDLMFAEYGSDDTVVIAGGGTLTQEMVEDASVRSALNFGNAETLYIDPRVLSAYNKILLQYQRNNLAGSPQQATGSDLQKQWVSGGTVSFKASRFLSGKSRPAPFRPKSGLVTTGMSVAPVSTTDASAPTAFEAGQVFWYGATPCNELGEGPQCAAASVTIATDADKVVVTITHPSSGTVRYFNMYRTVAGAPAGTQKFIGRVAIAAGASTTAFVDLGNKIPGFVTGFLLEKDTMGMKEMAPYSRLKMAVVDLSTPEAHFRFTTLAVYQPRKNVLVDNLQ
jgi:hypothetical protein